MICNFLFLLVAFSSVHSKPIPEPPGEEEYPVSESEWGPDESFEGLDTNKDGKVSLAEFISFRLQRFIGYDWFGKFDTSGDGFLDLTEVREITDSDDDAKEIMDKTDTNKDGKISRDENYKYVTDTSTTVFKTFDHDHDGYLSKPDFEELSKTVH